MKQKRKYDRTAGGTRTAILIHGIPNELRNKFKGACAREGKRMQDVIAELMNNYIRDTWSNEINGAKHQSWPLVACPTKRNLASAGKDIK